MQTLSSGARRFFSKFGRRQPRPDPIDPRAAIDPERRRLSEQYLSGDGLEIGALHCPLWTSDRARVRYVDRLPVERLREHYPELDALELARVDLVDDGETLGRIEDRSQDFIIANHQLEHCENPLGTLRCHLRKLKPGGVLYYAIPDRRHTFDRDREITPFEHLVRDDREGPEVSRAEHYREWARFVAKLPSEEQVEAEAERLMAMQYSIHFHVWEFESFRELLTRAGDHLDESFRVEELVRNGEENVAVLREGD